MNEDEGITLEPCRVSYSHNNSDNQCCICTQLALCQCTSCNSYICLDHLTDNLCYYCIKKVFYDQEIQSEKEKLEALQGQLSRLSLENEAIQTQILSTDMQIQNLNKILTTQNSSHLDQIKKRLDLETKNTKNLQNSAENMKNALNCLNYTQTLLNKSASSKQTHTDTFADTLEKSQNSESSLLAELHKLQQHDRKCVPYTLIRSFTCNNCHEKLKHLYSSKIMDCTEKNDSIYRSMLTNKTNIKGKRQNNDNGACSCNIV
ncbi:hypothetical protein SteCoe_7214 [Stentor coeruleus]|uniref:Uncharacterized protein n=1 Tax=Stentor coeruleus TaxID=5963 RepID=A0A1R2CN21_9CILI|nr:hypothetical protein SteCoe_7214 [Stentor coeruleus]